VTSGCRSPGAARRRSANTRQTPDPRVDRPCPAGPRNGLHLRPRGTQRDSWRATARSGACCSDAIQAGSWCDLAGGARGLSFLATVTPSSAVLAAPPAPPARKLCRPQKSRRAPEVPPGPRSSADPKRPSQDPFGYSIFMIWEHGVQYGNSNVPRDVARIVQAPDDDWEDDGHGQRRLREEPKIATCGCMWRRGSR
jgi:hypothetical protein